MKMADVPYRDCKKLTSSSDAVNTYLMILVDFLCMGTLKI